MRSQPSSTRMPPMDGSIARESPGTDGPILTIILAMPSSNAHFALGLAALGRPGYITIGHAHDLAGDYDVAAMERRCHAVLDAAWAAGVRAFDAARSYGRAEEFLADWLRARAVAPGDVRVSSKWGYRYVADWRTQAAHHEIKDHSRAALEQQLVES